MVRRKRTGLKYGQGHIELRGSSWRARWQDGDVLRSKTFRFKPDTKDDVLEEAEAFLRSMARRKYIPAAERTVQELVEDWLDRGADRWKPATHATHTQQARKHVYPHLGTVKAIDLDTPRVQHWIDTLRRKGLAAATITRTAFILNAACKEAVALTILPKNPCAGVRKPSITRKPMTVWTRTDIQKVLATITDPMWYALYVLALTTGMRPGELRALQWRDIDLSGHTLTVTRTMSRDRDNRDGVGSSTKTGSSRTLSLPERVVAALSTWKAQQKVVDVQGFVFCRPDGYWLARSTWEVYHQRLCQQAGVPKITLHALRHSAATQMMEAGIHIKIVSETLGHKSIRITLDTYTQVASDMQAKAADAFDAWLQEATRKEG